MLSTTVPSYESLSYYQTGKLWPPTCVSTSAQIPLAVRFANRRPVLPPPPATKPLTALPDPDALLLSARSLALSLSRSMRPGRRQTECTGGAAQLWPPSSSSSPSPHLSLLSARSLSLPMQPGRRQPVRANGATWLWPQSSSTPLMSIGQAPPAWLPPRRLLLPLLRVWCSATGNPRFLL